MRIVKILIALIFFQMLPRETISQTGELTILQTNNGSTIDVSLYIKRTGADEWNMGYASFVVNYNFSAMNSPVEIGEGIWDNDVNPSYDDQIVAEYNGNRSASIEIGLAGGSQGIAVPADSVLIGKMRFTITNPVLTHNLGWNTIYSAVIDGTGKNVTANMTFVDASNGLLPVELASFISNVSANNVYLKWTTVSEINNAGFEIQRKDLLSSEWQSKGFLSGSVNSNELKIYEFIDRGLNPGSYQYRLKQSDINGNIEFFELDEVVSILNPEQFTLYQNFPNPFNPSTLITYKITEPARVKLTLYDALGKVVRQLVNDDLDAGYHQFELDASGLGSGVYFYKLESGSNVDMKSMMLLK
ncbi:MAG: T9SS type A sorting domain-containing protein [Ignavibacteria bacterium]